MKANSVSYLAKLIAENSDDRAFDELFRLYFPSLLSFSESIIKDRHIAEEVVVDVFLKLWENRNLLPSIKNLSQYLYIATKHATISHMRSKRYTHYKATIPLNDFGEAIEYYFTNNELQLVSKENLQSINNAINALPTKCRLIFKLIKEDGLKYNEAAQLLNLSPKTIENQMTIAVKRIIELLKNSFPDMVKRYNK